MATDRGEPYRPDPKLKRKEFEKMIQIEEVREVPIMNIPQMSDDKWNEIARLQNASKTLQNTSK